MYDRITNCDVCECAECPEYGDDCDGDKRNDELISRADAIEAVCGVVIDEFDVSPTRGYEVAEKALSALPSAEPSLKAIKRQIDEHWYLDPPSAEAVQGWIPVEEQPPQFPCLVCDANGNQPSVPLGIVTITDEEHGEWHIDGRLWDTKIFFKGEWCSQTGYGNRIIAWMPLPKPYKGGDSE